MTATGAALPRSRATDLALVALVLAQLAVVWGFDFFPSQDGPAHVANAWLLKNLSALPLAAEYFELNLAAIPNWFSHLFLAGALFVVPALVAEKLLLSVYVVGLAWSLRYLARSVHGVNAPPTYLLGLAVTFNFSLYLGFYNFNLGLIGYLFALGYWWRRRDAMHLADYVILDALLVGMYFVHLLPTLMLLGSLLTLGALTAQGQLGRRAALFMALAPAWCLPLWYLSATSGAATEFLAPDELARYLVALGPLVTFEAQQPLAHAVGFLLLALVLGTIVERFNVVGHDPARPRGRFVLRSADAFYGLFAALVGVYLLAPNFAGEGAYISARLAMLPLLILPVALTLAGPRRMNVAACVLGAGLFAAQFALLVGYHHRLEAELADVTSARDVAGENKTLMPLFFSTRGAVRGNRTQPLLHASNYYVPAGIVSLENYEAETTHFPLRFRDDRAADDDRPHGNQLQYLPETVDPVRYVDVVDVVLTWDLDPSSPTAVRLGEHYREQFVSASGRLRLFGRTRR